MAAAIQAVTPMSVVESPAWASTAGIMLKISTATTAALVPKICRPHRNTIQHASQKNGRFPARESARRQSYWPAPRRTGWCCLRTSCRPGGCRVSGQVGNDGHHDARQGRVLGFVVVKTLVQPLHPASDVSRLIRSVVEHGVGQCDARRTEQCEGREQRSGRGVRESLRSGRGARASLDQTCGWRDFFLGAVGTSLP